MRPLSPALLIHHFGTDRPTADHHNDTMARSYEAMETSRPGEESTTLLGELRGSTHRRMFRAVRRSWVVEGAGGWIAEPLRGA